MNTNVKTKGVVAAGVLLVAGAVWAQSSVKLVINGNAVNTQTRVINGKTWVPLDDIAKALKMQKYASGGQITLRPAGGTEQAGNKLKGEQGEELFSGRWKFSVVGVTRSSKYEMKRPGSHTDDAPAAVGDNEELVAIDCRIRNGTKEKQEFAFAHGEWGENTALTDMNEESYQPVSYDVSGDEGAPLGKYALPGSVINFTIVFRVPKNTKLKDLVYSVVLYHERGDKKGTDFRVALKG